MKKFIKTKFSEYIKEVNMYNYEVYHCSNERFTYFDQDKITNIHGALYGPGFYFSDNIEYVKKFGKNIYKCSIRLDNPINLKNEKIAKTHLIQLLNNIKEIDKVDVESINELIHSKAFTGAFRKICNYLTIMELSKMFDGVIGYCEEGGSEYVVYNTNNIKIITIN